MKYCAETEHCTQDVMRKMGEWGVEETDIVDLLEVLLREKFVDDARYAMSYVSEKWKLYQWGKIKIRHQLEEKGISESLVEAAIDSIPQQEYISAVEDILHHKWTELKGKNDVATLKKVAAFGASRGIEEELIEAWIESNRQ